MTEELIPLILAYEELMKGIDYKAERIKNRAYGGIIRAGKGKLVEKLTENLILIAWEKVLKQDIKRLKINKSKIAIDIKSDYIKRIENKDVREFLEKNYASLNYKFGTDVQVFVDNELVLPIECKTYTENAMLKRIIFDAELMKESRSSQRYYLVQLESQLGGDYSELNAITYGSGPTHTLLSYASIDLIIITLLKGERKVDKPIHKKEYYKPLELENLEKALKIFVNSLEPYKK